MFVEDPVENPYAGLGQDSPTPGAGADSGGGAYTRDPYYPNPYDWS